jgi:tryptophanyl-tRNA synthetase
MTKKRVFSGIRPTGEVHLGNYFGALRNWVNIQDDYNCIYCVVDYHAITTPFEAQELPKLTFDMTAALLACGVDPEKCSLVIQSDIHEHTELSWVLSCIAPLGQMERMTQFKEKSNQSPDSINLGLLAYPALMASDIMVYRAEAVPVGEDQIQHLELTRDLARKFNNAYGEFFPEPEPLLTQTPRLMGLDGKSKMSKSLNNHISMFEPADSLQKKIMTAVTDENRKRRNDPGNPEICNIFALHNIFSQKEEVENIDSECRKAGIGCVDCKKDLCGKMEQFLTPFRDRYQKLQNQPDDVYAITQKGAEQCRPIAQETMDGVKERLGIKKYTK